MSGFSHKQLRALEEADGRFGDIIMPREGIRNSAKSGCSMCWIKVDQRSKDVYEGKRAKGEGSRRLPTGSQLAEKMMWLTARGGEGDAIRMKHMLKGSKPEWEDHRGGGGKKKKKLRGIWERVQRESREKALKEPYLWPICLDMHTSLVSALEGREAELHVCQ